MKKKETKFSQHMQIELIFVLEEANRESKNLWVIPRMLHIAVNLSYIFFNKRKLVYIFFN